MPPTFQPSSLGLRGIDLLQGVPAERLDEISRQCAWRHFEARQQLVTRHAEDRDLHFIVAGSVRVTSYSSAGRETNFRELAAGSAFGEVSALDGLPRAADLVALTPGLLASLPPPAFSALLRAEWVVNERVLLRLADLVRRATERVVDLSTLSVQQRICRELLRLARESGVDGNQARIATLPKHAQLASVVSTYREQITRDLSALVRAGVLAKDGTALVVCDMGRLEKLAGAKGAH